MKILTSDTDAFGPLFCIANTTYRPAFGFCWGLSSRHLSRQHSCLTQNMMPELMTVQYTEPFTG